MKKAESSAKWPFYNGGYMSGRRLFDILLLKRREEIDELMTEARSDEITEERLRRMYREFLAESILGLTDREKKWLTDMEAVSLKKSGVLFSLIGMTDWDIRVGSCCVIKEHCKVEASADGVSYKKLDFLWPEDRDEIARIIRVTSIEETGRELTLSEPETVSDGFRAVRSVRGEWGMEVRGRRGRKYEEHLL